jgi:hypothetical protein
MKKTLVLAVSAIALVSSAAFAQNTTDAAAAPKAAHAKHHTKKVHKAHVAKKGDASPEESTTK